MPALTVFIISYTCVYVCIHYFLHLAIWTALSLLNALIIIIINVFCQIDFGNNSDIFLN